MDELKVIRLDPRAHPPERANPGDLGYDLFSLERVVIPAGGAAPVRTGIAVEFPRGWGGIIKDRSSMAVKGIAVSAGVIDNGYRGEIAVVLNNHASASVTIEPDRKIAQLVPAPVTDWTVKVVESLSETERGDGGFGSSGTHKV